MRVITVLIDGGEKWRWNAYGGVNECARDRKGGVPTGIFHCWSYGLRFAHPLAQHSVAYRWRVYHFYTTQITHTHSIHYTRHTAADTYPMPITFTGAFWIRKKTAFFDRIRSKHFSKCLLFILIKTENICRPCTSSYFMANWADFGPKMVCQLTAHFDNQSRHYDKIYANRKWKWTLLQFEKQHTRTAKDTANNTTERKQATAADDDVSVDVSWMNYKVAIKTGFLCLNLRPTLFFIDTQNSYTYTTSKHFSPRSLFAETLNVLADFGGWFVFLFHSERAIFSTTPQFHLCLCMPFMTACDQRLCIFRK